MSDDLKSNISNSDHWIKALLILVYGIIFYVAIWVLGLVVLINLVVLLVTGRRNDNLADFGRQTADYLNQIMAFCTLNSEHHPFPFGDWPDRDGDREAGASAAVEPPPPAVEPEASKPAPPARPAPAAKKTSTKKKKATRRKARSRKKATGSKTGGSGTTG